MINLEQEILNNLKNNISVFLIEPVDSGKTFFVLNSFIPFLEKMRLTCRYFPNCEEISRSKEDIIIIDEVETLIDKTFLEKNHPKENPYYSKEYLEKVKKWHEKLKKIHQPCLYIITRNSKKDIDNLLNIESKTDWDDRKIKIMEIFS